MKKINKGKVQYIFFILMFYVFILQDAIQNYINVFRYVDEIYAFLAIPIMISEIVKRIKEKNTKFEKTDIVIVFGILICIVSGAISSIINKYQNFIVSATDMFLILKFFLAMYVTKDLFKDNKLYEYKEKISIHTKIVITILFLLTIISYFTDIFPSGIRYGIKYVQLFYSHPSIFVMNIIFVLVTYLWTTNVKIFNLYALMALFMIIATLRAKAFGAVAIIVLLYYYLVYKGKKVKVKECVILAILAIIVGHEQIYYYFVEIDDSARTKLLSTSIEIAKDYFPLGTGFGTYASFMSAENYSTVYYMYGLNNIYGLSEDFNDFMCDSFWPMIIGQFGVLGTIGYIMALIGIFYKIQKNYEKDKYKYFLLLVALVYLLISSTSEAAFVHYMAIPIAFLIQILLQSDKMAKGEKDNE